MAKKGPTRGDWYSVAILFVAGVVSFLVVLPVGAIFIFVALVLGLYLLDQGKVRSPGSS